MVQLYDVKELNCYLRWGHFPSFAMVRPAAAVEARSPKVARTLNLNIMRMANGGSFSEGNS
jgi:heterodisulfide reductase subunit B